ncbi:hypothetical protein SK1NUM_00750 [Arachnia rubra]|nr:hypothetical protein SK1NUM_00750 [Arachnia rubra]
MGLCQEGTRHGEPLPHTKRVSRHSLIGRVAQPHEFELLRDQSLRDAGRCRHPQEVFTPGAWALDRLQHGANHLPRVAEGAEILASNTSRASRGCHQAEKDLHRSGLAGSVGAEESGDLTGMDLEGQTVNNRSRIETFRETVHGDDSVEC